MSTAARIAGTTDRAIRQFQTLQTMRPDLAARVMAGTLELRDATGVMKRQERRAA